MGRQRRSSVDEEEREEKSPEDTWGYNWRAVSDGLEGETGFYHCGLDLSSGGYCVHGNIKAMKLI